MSVISHVINFCWLETIDFQDDSEISETRRAAELSKFPPRALKPLNFVRFTVVLI